MTTLYIIRGLPGAGKSTLAREIKEKTGADHWEADQYFVKDGVYQFDGSKIGEAHNQCHMNFYESLLKNRDVIVSNTFTKIQEFQEYIADAQAHKYDVFVVECLDNYGSIHNVPQSSMDRMRARWEPNSKLEAFWLQLEISNDIDWYDIQFLNQDEFHLFQTLKS